MSAFKDITLDGLWRNNVGLVQLLGLCPLLAVSNTVINGFALGVATLLTLVGSNTIVSLIRNHMSNEIRIPVFVLIIASLVTAIELIINAWFYELSLTLGIFIPLIVTNCAIIGRAEAFASRNPPLASAIDGFAMGAGFTLVLVTLGAIREAIGSGTLFSGAELMFGEWASAIELVLIPDYRGFLIAVLPPGAFLTLGFLIAGKNALERRQRQTTPQTATSIQPASTDQPSSGLAS